MAQLIDGKRISKEIKDELKAEVDALKGRGIQICLAVVQVGQDPASCVYVNNKKKACAYIGIESESYELPDEVSEEELLALVDRDLASGLKFSNGDVLIGQNWLFVQNARGKPVIRLEHIQGVFHHQTPKGAVVLKFADPRGAGPVARELTADEAGRIEAYLQRKVVHQ